MRETDIKAALIDHLRSMGEIKRGASLISELAIGMQSNRVDLTLVDDRIHHFEIKSAFDSLSRLDDQINSYLKCSDLVTLAVSTRHLNAAISRIPESVGVLEITTFDATSPIKKVREPAKSPNIENSAMLEIMPVEAIKEHFQLSDRSLRRADLPDAFKDVDVMHVKHRLTKFLHNRYGPSTRSFLRKVRGRAIKRDDLDILRLWSAERSSICKDNFDASYEDMDRMVFASIGESFGPIPDYIRSEIES